MPRWFKWTLGVLAVAVLGLIAIWAYAMWSISNMELDFNDAVYKEWDARTAMMVGLSQPQCLTRDVVIQQAQARGWVVQDAASLGECDAPEGLANWLRVITEDGLLLPGNPENATYFGFDGDGFRFPYASMRESAPPAPAPNLPAAAARPHWPKR